jgi:membrane-associated phospholipid phosphatase
MGDMPLTGIRTFAGLTAMVPFLSIAAAQEVPAPSPSPTSIDQPAPPASPPTISAPSPGAAPARWVPDDKRRTMRGYWANLRYNFIGVVTPGNHMPLLVTAALTAPAFAWDDECEAYFAKHPHDQFGKIGANLGGGIAVAGLTLGFFSAGRYSHSDRFRATTYDISQAVIINQVYTQVVKVATHRERPDGSNHQSFFSGHASNAFAAASVVALHYRRLAVPTYAVATFIATSRLAANKHHFSDVVAGAGFGFGVGRAVVRRNGRPPDKPGATDIVRWDVMPSGGPAGDGTGVQVRVTF